jgi:Flp pilus assembly protein TadD
VSAAGELLSRARQAHQAGHLPQAEALYRQILQVEPNSAEALLGLGTLCLQQGKLAEAVPPLEQFVGLEPHRTDALNNLGIALANLGRPAEAINHFQQALRLQPNNPGTYNNMALTLFKQGRFADAERCWREVLRLFPDHPDVHNSLGIALAEQDRLDVAVGHFERAARLKPYFPEAYSNRALALVGLGRFEEAEAVAGQALRLRPGYPDAANHLGLALLKQGRLEEAMSWFNEALRLRPDHAETHKNRAICWLLQGDYARGWPEFEWRWKCKDFVPRRFPQPPWDGSPLDGRTILLHAEQGLGDTLQFIRYAPLVKQRGGNLLLECPPAMHRLLASCRGIDQFHAKGGPRPAFDVHAALMSLPGLLGTTLQTVPAEIPYVFAEPALVEKWRQELASVSGFKIGINWKGSPRYRADQQRRVPLAAFAPLARLPGVKLFSLQKGFGTEELAQVAGQFEVTDLGPRMEEEADAFIHTAAVMKNLDLIVTSDTAVPHLAGALGVPVWIALPHVPDWRWKMDREDSPWYPTARLFRQKRSGDWADMFERIAIELAKFPFAARTENP